MLTATLTEWMKQPCWLVQNEPQPSNSCNSCTLHEKFTSTQIRAFSGAHSCEKKGIPLNLVTKWYSSAEGKWFALLWSLFACLQQTLGTRLGRVHSIGTAAAGKSLQSCPTLWDPIDGSPPGSPVPGVLQARTLEWVAISFSNAWKRKVKSLSRVRLLATPWTAAHQAPLSLGFSRQEHWSGLPFPSPMHESEKWKWSRSVVPDS